MEKEKIKGIIEAVLFASSRTVKVHELITLLELPEDQINEIIAEMQEDMKKEARGLEIVRIQDGFQLASKKDYYEYLYPVLDRRIKPQLSNASLEVLAIIAYNPRVTRADIDQIRGVDSSASLYKLQEYGLVEQAGKSDLPGKPMTYRTSEEFLKMFGINSLRDLPNLPKFKLDSNRQIVIDEVEADVETSEVMEGNEE